MRNIIFGMILGALASTTVVAVAGYYDVPGKDDWAETDAITGIWSKPKPSLRDYDDPPRNRRNPC